MENEKTVIKSLTAWEYIVRLPGLNVTINTKLMKNIKFAHDGGSRYRHHDTLQFSSYRTNLVANWRVNNVLSRVSH